MRDYTDIKAKGTWSLAKNSCDIIAVKAKNTQEKNYWNYKALGCRYLHPSRRVYEARPTLRNALLKYTRFLGVSYLTQGKYFCNDYILKIPFILISFCIQFNSTHMYKNKHDTDGGEKGEDYCGE